MGFEVIVAIFFFICSMLYCKKMIDEMRGSKASPKKDSKFLSAQKAQQAKYELLLSKLPKKSLNKLISYINIAVKSTSSSDNINPLKLFNMRIGAEQSVKKETSRPRYNSEKQKKIDSIIDTFGYCVDSTIQQIGLPASGLDFGIITNNAADMALYGVMNQLEKNKQNRAQDKKVEQIFDTLTENLYTDLSNLLIK